MTTHNPEDGAADVAVSIESISAVTLATHDMARATAFYDALGFVPAYSGPEASFTSYRVGMSYLNLIPAAADVQWSWWGRVIFYVSDVDALHRRAVARGLHPETAPADAPWRERFFHIRDPDGHELSFAVPLRRSS